MMVRLLEPHVIANRWWPTATEMELPQDVRVTPLMVGLDDEAQSAIAEIKVAIFGRWIWDPDARRWYLLDNPPIQRPITDPQPEHPIPGGGPGQ